MPDRQESSMQTVLIVIHLMVVVAMIAVVLLQRSEGGALGMGGGGGGGGGFMSARGAADALTRTTAILAAIFFATSLALGIWARYDSRPTDILDRIEQNAPAEGTSILDQLGGGTTEQAPAEEDGQVPTGQ
jgi:preprotein translocase subunit SecG